MCVYKTTDGLCRNFSDAVHTSYCIEGPCPHDKPSNADRIRAMSDEELAAWIIQLQENDVSEQWCDSAECLRRINAQEDFNCTDEMLLACAVRWLEQPGKDE